MERISQADVITTLEKLHQELKAQTRDTKVDQHHLLRKSFHYVTATLYKPSQLVEGGPGSGAGGNSGRTKLGEVTHRVLQELFALLVGGDGFAPPRIRILAAALARELSAGELPYFFRDNFGGNFAQYDQNKVKYVLPVLSELSNSKLLIQNISNLVNWFTADNEQLGLKMVSLSNLIVLAQRYPNVLDKDKHIRPMEAKFQQLLIGASLETRKTISTTLFGVRIVSTSSACMVTELDGTPSHDFFTCINNSYDYSEDQILNVHVFSSLYHWLFHLYQAQLLRARRKQSRDDIVTKLEHFGLVHPTADRDHGAGDELDDDEEDFCRNETPGAGPRAQGSGHPQGDVNEVPTDPRRYSPIGHFKLDERFRQVVISICLRILSQVERDIVAENVTQMRLGQRYVVSDLEWMKEFTEATSMEAIRILDLLCLMDPSLVSRIFPAVKKVYERTANRQSGLVFAAVLQFFVNHGQHVIFDVDPVLHHFFVDYVSVRYRHQLLAMSTLLFLTTNTSKMLLHTPVFPKYYPAIIKLLAWHPRTVASEILPLIPAMVGPATFTELFHTLLDLPLTAAFMEQCDRPEEQLAESQWSKIFPDRHSPAFRATHQYILRNEAGGGKSLWETRDEAQLAVVDTLWNNLPVTPRVSSVCKLVPRFLSVYFDVLLTNAPPACIERVVPLLLQRFSSLYPVDFFLDAVHLLIIDTLQAIFQQWPSFLMSLKNEVVHAISVHLDMQGQLLVLHLCWIVGELLSPTMCTEDSKADIAVFFEALEMLAYEAISVHSHSHGDRAAADKKRHDLRGHAGGPKPEIDTATCGSSTAPSASPAAVAHGASNNTGHSNATGGDHSSDNASAATSSAETGGVTRHESTQALSSVEHNDEQPCAARTEDGDEDGHGAEGAATATDHSLAAGASEVVFSPRFIAVIIASLTKLGTKFPEFAPRVVLCVLRMRQHFETDLTPGIEFVRDRLTDSLQLLRHSPITNSIYAASQVLELGESDRFHVHRSSLSSLSHLSHNPSTFTVGALLHKFELPPEPPIELAALSSSFPADEENPAQTDLDSDVGDKAAARAGMMAMAQVGFVSPPEPPPSMFQSTQTPSVAEPSTTDTTAASSAVGLVGFPCPRSPDIIRTGSPIPPTLNFQQVLQQPQPLQPAEMPSQPSPQTQMPQQSPQQQAPVSLHLQPQAPAPMHAQAPTQPQAPAPVQPNLPVWSQQRRLSGQELGHTDADASVAGKLPETGGAERIGNDENLSQGNEQPMPGPESQSPTDIFQTAVGAYPQRNRAGIADAYAQQQNAPQGQPSQSGVTSIVGLGLPGVGTTYAVGSAAVAAPSISAISLLGNSVVEEPVSIPATQSAVAGVGFRSSTGTGHAAGSQTPLATTASPRYTIHKLSAPEAPTSPPRGVEAHPGYDTSRSPPLPHERPASTPVGMASSVGMTTPRPAFGSLMGEETGTVASAVSPSANVVGSPGVPQGAGGTQGNVVGSGGRFLEQRAKDFGMPIAVPGLSLAALQPSVPPWGTQADGPGFAGNVEDFAALQRGAPPLPDIKDGEDLLSHIGLKSVSSAGSGSAADALLRLPPSTSSVSVPQHAVLPAGALRPVHSDSFSLERHPREESKTHVGQSVARHHVHSPSSSSEDSTHGHGRAASFNDVDVADDSDHLSHKAKHKKQDPNRKHEFEPEARTNASLAAAIAASIGGEAHDVQRPATPIQQRVPSPFALSMQSLVAAQTPAEAGPVLQDPIPESRGAVAAGRSTQPLAAVGAEQHVVAPTPQAYDTVIFAQQISRPLTPQQLLQENSEETKRPSRSSTPQKPAEDLLS